MERSTGEVTTSLRGRTFAIRTEFEKSNRTFVHEAIVWLVLRVLNRTRVALDFVELGFSTDQISTLQGLLQEPNGIILVTGPTGSGKTTTLYTPLVR